METKVYKDVKDSPYKIGFRFNGHEIVFHFSSLFNQKRFISHVNEYKNNEELKLRNKYQLEIDVKIYLAIVYYKKIEKRGFFIELDGLEFKEYEYYNVVKIERR